MSRFYFTLCRYFLGHVACWNLPWRASKKERSGAAFTSLRRWLSGWKRSEVILSHTTNQLQFYKQLLHAQFCLDRNIMVHNMTNIPARSGCGLINAEALLGRDTTSVQTNYNHR